VGACASAHQSADLLGTVGSLRKDDPSAGPVNSWFQTCVLLYSSCANGTVDPTDGWGYEGPIGREISSYYRLAMWMLRTLVAAGVATVDASGHLVGANGELLDAYAWFANSGQLIASGDGPPESDWNFTLGVTTGVCIFFCLELGVSGEGPYIRPGVGVAIDSPGIVVSNQSPDCGSEESLAYVAVGVGPAQYSGGAVSPGRSGDWTGYGPQFTGFNLPDGGSTPHYKIFSAGAGVVHNWTFC
jgi:hypothetical protein